MFEEEPRPKRRQGLEPAKLEGWDVGELRDYIEALRAEINRAEAALAKQDGHRSAAEAFFRRP
ncbi:DUF1192 domain-containing protein [Sabulicella rubraurantiaca]|uniref:DUF1192 domain-containing protein n=1 Tax=Sabulicella rubraurantiaca TaxID=2811429 RepID=UPI001A972749|nr:DUF1192 domain-containing protein [Sabulicella rubraurantiaca]